MALCRLCGKEKKLIRAHIIPEKFYTRLNEGAYKLVAKDKFPSRSQKGLYDGSILCQECDNEILGIYDKEAINLLINNINKYETTSLLQKAYNEKHYTIPCAEFNYARLRKFFVSLIWRASITTNETFEMINLGKYEQVALDILNDVSDDYNLFATIIFKLAPTLNYSDSVFTAKRRIDHTVIYEFYFGGYCVCIYIDFSKVSTNTHSKLISNYIIKPNHNIEIFTGDVFNNQHYIVDLARKQKDFMNRIKGA